MMPSNGMAHINGKLSKGNAKTVFCAFVKQNFLSTRSMNHLCNGGFIIASSISTTVHEFKNCKYTPMCLHKLPTYLHACLVEVHSSRIVLDHNVGCEI